MWAVVEAGLCTMHDLRHNLTIDDYFSAWQYLLSKQEATQKALEESKRRGNLEQLARQGGLG